MTRNLDDKAGQEGALPTGPGFLDYGPNSLILYNLLYDLGEYEHSYICTLILLHLFV